MQARHRLRAVGMYFLFVTEGTKLGIKIPCVLWLVEPFSRLKLYDPDREALLLPIALCVARLEHGVCAELLDNAWVG